jgi:SAM-dependent methyltransferase
MTKATGAVALVVIACAGTALTSRQHHPQKPDHMQHRFDDPDHYAKLFDDPARDSWQLPARVIDTLALPATSSIADIGAGTGYFSIRLARAVPRGVVYAVDIEPAMLGHIRKRAAAEGLQNVITVHGSSANPTLPKPVDLVIVVDTYHHLPSRVTYFRDLGKSLAPGGRVAVIDFRKDAPDGPPPEFRFEADHIIREMAEAGYRLDARHDFLPRQHFLVFSAGPR